MEKTDIEYFKNKLEAERALLEKELNTIAVQSSDNPDNWDAKPTDVNDRSADLNKLADNIEEQENNEGIINNLEKQLLDVKDALEKIEEGRYGLCEVSGEMISKERLEANPAARTTIENIDKD
jgi:RNA polymerase-binding transcription factor DksA